MCGMTGMPEIAHDFDTKDGNTSKEIAQETSFFCTATPLTGTIESNTI